MTDLTNIAVDRLLDLQGECCPYPPIYTMQEIEEMASGQVLEVLVDHPPAVTNVPREAARHGHEVLGDPVRRGAVYHIYIKKR
jgi:tRNA 2-thiouridine synthesizing protein A